MTKYTDEGLVTDDPVISAMFLGKEAEGEIEYECGTACTPSGCPGHVAFIEGAISALTEDGICMMTPYEDQDPMLSIRIPWPTVFKKLKPVEGEAWIGLSHEKDHSGFAVYSAYEDSFIRHYRYRYNWRVINICQTYGQLRELLRYREEGV